MYYLDIVPALNVELPFTSFQKDGKIVLSMGPQFSAGLLGTERKKIGTHAPTKSSVHFSIQTDFSQVDLGIDWGIAYQNSKGFIQLDYQYGFANIDNNAYKDYGNIQNRLISLRAGYFIK
jgi:hypothetical protein